MRKDAIKHPGRFYATWAVSLAALLGIGIAANILLSSRVVRWREDDPSFHLAAADRFMNDKNYVEAKAELDKVLSLAPVLPEAYVLRGHLHYKLNQWNEARAAYEKAIEYRTENPYVPGRVLWCLMNTQRYAEAAEYGRMSLDKGLGTPSLKRDTGEAYLLANKPAQAIPFLEAALKDSPRNIDVMERLVRAYHATGQEDKAKSMLQGIADLRSALQIKEN